jgi:hypothetical protein
MSGFGSFDGPIEVQFNNDGRTLTLLKPVTFTDPDLVKWPVPAGAVVDGASIPQAFWIVIGGPLEDRYRDASVIHDYYCDHHAHTWKATHRVFYNGMRARSVNEIKAKIMYYAVYNFGPRWPAPGALTTLQQFNIQDAVRTGAPEHIAIVQQLRDYRDVPSVAAAVAQIEQQNPSLDDIERLAPAF